MGNRINASRWVAIGVILLGVGARHASADVYVTDGTGTQVNHYRDDGSLVLALPQFWGEGIYDLTHASNGTLIGASNTLGILDLGQYNPDPSQSVRLAPTGSPYPLYLVSANAPIAGTPDGGLLVGVNGFYSPPPLNLVTEHSIARVNLQTGETSTLIQFNSALTAMSEIKASPTGDIFVRFVDDTVRRIQPDGTRSLIATGVKSIAVDSRDGDLAFLNANNQIVSADPITGATLGVLVPQASLDGTPITDFTFGPGNSLLVGTIGVLADRAFTVQSFDLTNGSHHLFATTYSYFGVGSIEYVVPEPASLAMLTLLGPCVARRRRR